MVIYQRVNFSVLTYLTRSDQERRSSEKKARKALNMSDVPAVILGSESHFGNRGVGLWVVQGQVGETTDFCTDNSIICWCKYVLCDRMCVQNYVHLTSWYFSCYASTFRNIWNIHVTYRATFPQIPTASTAPEASWAVRCAVVRNLRCTCADFPCTSSRSALVRGISGFSHGFQPDLTDLTSLGILIKHGVPEKSHQ